MSRDVLPPTAFDAPSEGNRNANFTLPQAALDALKAGNTIEAIKIVREATGVGLAEAKAIVDMIQGQMKSGGGSTLSSLAGAARIVAGSNANKGLAPGQVSSGGGAGKWLALVAVIAIVIAVAIFY
ncbi:MAG: ribosomal protein L7/L12 [Usitatibacter sp.]